jgi:ABC-type microcin C transport system permease subunit YejE
MEEVIYQGDVATDGSTKIFCTTSSLNITNIIIINTVSNYVFNLNKFKNDASLPTVPIYELSLNAGDTVRDTDSYILYTFDYIQLISDVPGTTYYIRATRLQ